MRTSLYMCAVLLARPIIARRSVELFEWSCSNKIRAIAVQCIIHILLNTLLLTETTAALSDHNVRGLYFLAVVFVATMLSYVIL